MCVCVIFWSKEGFTFVKEIGNRIAILRRDAGLNQEQLAKHIHVCTSAIGMYEQGRRIPGVDVMVAIAEYFDVSLDYLITGHEKKFWTNGKRTRDMQEVYLCEQERAAIMSLAKKL